MVRHPLYIFVDEQIIQILLDGICVCLDGIPDFLNILLKQLIDDIVCLYNLFCQLKIFIMEGLHHVGDHLPHGREGLTKMSRRRDGFQGRQLLDVDGDVTAVVRDPLQVADHPHIARKSPPVRRNRLLLDNDLNAPFLNIRLHRINQRVVFHDRIRRHDIHLLQRDDRPVNGEQHLLAHRLHPVIDFLQLQVISFPCSHTYLLTLRDELPG